MEAGTRSIPMFSRRSRRRLSTAHWRTENSSTTSSRCCQLSTPTSSPRHAERWIGNKAGGILGKVSMVYFSPREYVVLFGSPSGTQGFSGRYKHVSIHKIPAGRPDRFIRFGIRSITLTITASWRTTCLEKGHTRGLTIHPGSWHLEYGRGAVATTLPFAMAETLLTSLELPSLVLSTKEFARLVLRRPSRQSSGGRRREVREGS